MREYGSLLEGGGGMSVGSGVDADCDREAVVLIPCPCPCPTSPSLLASGVSAACSRLTERLVAVEPSATEPSARERTFLEETSLAWFIRCGPTRAEGLTAGAGNWNLILEFTGERAELLFRGLRLTAIPLNRSNACMSW